MLMHSGEFDFFFNSESLSGVFQRFFRALSGNLWGVFGVFWGSLLIGLLGVFWGSFEGLLGVFWVFFWVSFGCL